MNKKRLDILGFTTVLFCGIMDEGAYNITRVKLWKVGLFRYYLVPY